MTDAPPLIAAPYFAPTCIAGDWIDDEIDGSLQVGGWTTAPISWPRRRKTGRPALILTSELVRAVQTESAAAICHWWGVGPTKVWQWRQALGVGRVTDGTRLRLQQRTGVPPEAAARGRALATSAERLTRMAATKRGVPVPAATRAGLLRAAKRRKPAGWGVRANAKMLGRELPALHAGEWTAAEEDYLCRHYGKRDAISIGLAIGRKPESVKNKAKKMGLMQRVRSWRAADDDYLRDHYAVDGAQACAQHLRRNISAVYTRAMQIGVSKARGASRGRVFNGSRLWHQVEDDQMRRLYGRVPISDLAAQLDRSIVALHHRAHKLGLTTPPTSV